MSLDQAAVKRKVRSLLALAAPGSGATEPERATARAMADKLLAQHGLREADIPERQVARRQPPPPPPQVVRIFVSVGGFWGFGFSGFDNSTSTTTGF